MLRRLLSSRTFIACTALALCSIFGTNSHVAAEELAEGLSNEADEAAAAGVGEPITQETNAAGNDPSDGEQAARQEELERRVEILTEEVQTLKEQLVLPEKDEYVSQYGLGPAASKVYGIDRGLSIGGYAEFSLDFLVKEKQSGSDYDVGDYIRYVQYLGYKFTDKLIANAEIELEHATTGANFAGKGGSVSLEFAYLDYLAHPLINLRMGVVLVPVGFINEIHEPVFFHGNHRPDVERVIIPTTWRELGGGIFGEVLPGLTYKVFAVSGFNGEKFSDEGWRGGRQKAGRALIENWGVVGRIDYDWENILVLGGSVYYGGADQNRVPGVNSNTFLTEGHAQIRFQSIEFRALGVYGHLSDAAQLTQAILPTPTDPAAPPETRVIANEVYGWYVEGAYDVMPLFGAYDLYLAPYFRFERFDTQAGIPTLAGRTANPALDRTNIEAGLTFKPHPQVAIKLNYKDRQDNGTAPREDSVVFGAGFIY